MKRLPTNVKILRGTFQKCRENPNEPKPKLAIPSCPPHLDEEARKEWRRIAKELFTLGLLTKIDRAALAGYCQCWSRWSHAEEELKKTGLVVQSPNGYPILSPYLPIATKALQQMQSFLSEFGLSPASRSKVSATAVLPERQNKLAKYLTNQSPGDELTNDAEERFFGAK